MHRGGSKKLLYISPKNLLFVTFLRPQNNTALSAAAQQRLK
jgi:hypothetical protein